MARTPSDKALITIEELIPYLTDTSDPEYSIEQMDVFRLMINGVSEYMQSYTKRSIRTVTHSDYLHGGKTCVLSRYPVFEVLEFKDGDDDYTGTYRITDSGIIVFDSPLAHGDYRYKITYLAGVAAAVEDVPEVWKLMCASTIVYMHNRDAANFTRAVEGVAIYPRELPPMVKSFLDKERDKGVAT